MKKKRMLSWLLAVMMCLSILPMTALAAEPTLSIEKTSYGPYSEIIVKFAGISEEMASDGAWVGIGEKEAGGYISGNEYWEYLTVAAGDTMLRAPMNKGDYEIKLYKNSNGSEDGVIQTIPFTVTSTLPQPDGEELDYSDYVPVEGSWAGNYETNWEEMVLTESNGVVSGTYTHDSGKITGTIKSTGIVLGTWSEAPDYTAPSNAGDIVFFMLEGGDSFLGYWRYGSEGMWRIWEPARRAKASYNSSDWAAAELARADELGLIPETLEGADLTADITRAEFAAVAVKVYENLANGEAIPAVINPFTDTKDVEILKAYNIGAVNGTSATTYSPDDLLNREQAAAMLTRVFKKISVPNWTLATDSQFTLPYEKPALFADDADISDWAKESVYFMVANGIINGVGNNKFAPQNTTTEEQAQGYANATREQALLIAVRMVENLK